MRKLFPEFNKPTKKELEKIWREAVFVFDTNVLLGLYRIPEQAREKMIAVLEKLKNENRIWIPHQVAKEFYTRRMDAIYNQNKSHDEAIKNLKKIEEEINKKFDSKEAIRNISRGFKDVNREVEKAKKRCEWFDNDKIEKQLNKIFTGRVSGNYEKDKLSEIYKQGQERYDKEIPPGYKDKKKDKEDKTGTKKFGDLVIWNQIIDRAKEIKKPIILVTDDQKEDWWWKINNDTTIGPRPELIREIKDQAGVPFYIYQSEQFMGHAGQYLKIKFGAALIKQVTEIKETARAERELVKPDVGGDLSSNDRVELDANANSVMGNAQNSNSSSEQSGAEEASERVGDNQTNGNG